MKTHTHKPISRPTRAKVKAVTAKARAPRSAASRRTHEKRLKGSFWDGKSIEQLATEQGVRPMTDWNYYFGAGRDLWESDEDFEAFLKEVRRPYEERA